MPDEINIDFNNETVKPLLGLALDRIATQTPFVPIFARIVPDGITGKMLGRLTTEKLSSYVKTMNGVDRVTTFGRNVRVNDIELWVRLYREWSRPAVPTNSYHLRVSCKFTPFTQFGVKVSNGIDTVHANSKQYDYDPLMETFEAFVLRLAGSFNAPANDPTAMYANRSRYFDSMRLALSKVKI